MRNRLLVLLRVLGVLGIESLAVKQLVNRVISSPTGTYGCVWQFCLALPPSPHSHSLSHLAFFICLFLKHKTNINLSISNISFFFFSANPILYSPIYINSIYFLVSILLVSISVSIDSSLTHGLYSFSVYFATKMAVSASLSDCTLNSTNGKKKVAFFSIVFSLTALITSH